MGNAGGVYDISCRECVSSCDYNIHARLNLARGYAKDELAGIDGVYLLLGDTIVFNLLRSLANHDDSILGSIPDRV